MHVSEPTLMEERSASGVVSSLIRDLVLRDLVQPEPLFDHKQRALRKGVNVALKRHAPEKAPPILVKECELLWREAYASLEGRRRMKLFVFWSSMALRADSLEEIRSSHFRVLKQGGVRDWAEHMPKAEREAWAMDSYGYNEELWMFYVRKDKVNYHEERQVFLTCNCLFEKMVEKGLIESVTLGGRLCDSRDLCGIHGEFALEAGDLPFSREEVRRVNNMTRTSLHSARITAAIGIRLTCIEMERREKLLTKEIRRLTGIHADQRLYIRKNAMKHKFGWGSESMFLAYASKAHNWALQDLVPLFGACRPLYTTDREQGWLPSWDEKFSKLRNPKRNCFAYANTLTSLDEFDPKINKPADLNAFKRVLDANDNDYGLLDPEVDELELEKLDKEIEKEDEQKKSKASRSKTCNLDKGGW